VVIAATLLFAVTMLDYLAGFILFPFAPGPYALAILLLSVIIPVLTAPLKPRFLKFRGIGDAAIVWFGTGRSTTTEETLPPRSGVGIREMTLPTFPIQPAKRWQ
jgi:hypothetical protein